MQAIWITKREAIKATGSARYVQRFMKAGWLRTVRKGAPGRPALFTRASLFKACARVERGEEPPLLPSEQKAKTSNTAKSFSNVQTLSQTPHKT